MFNRSRCVPSNINDKFVTLACTSAYFRAVLFPSVSCGMDPVFKQRRTNKVLEFDCVCLCLHLCIGRTLAHAVMHINYILQMRTVKHKYMWWYERMFARMLLACGFSQCIT